MSEEELMNRTSLDEYRMFDELYVNAFNRLLRDHEDYTTQDAYIILNRILLDRYNKFISKE